MPKSDSNLDDLALPVDETPHGGSRESAVVLEVERDVLPLLAGKSLRVGHAALQQGDSLRCRAGARRSRRRAPSRKPGWQMLVDLQQDFLFSPLRPWIGRPRASRCRGELLALEIHRGQVQPLA